MATIVDFVVQLFGLGVTVGVAVFAGVVGLHLAISFIVHLQDIFKE